MRGSGVEIGKMLTKRWEECSAAVGVYVGCPPGRWCHDRFSLYILDIEK
jgi:hypothetical protein